MPSEGRVVPMGTPNVKKKIKNRNILYMYCVTSQLQILSMDRTLQKKLATQIPRELTGGRTIEQRVSSKEHE